jgi:hypothetical protein
MIDRENNSSTKTIEELQKENQELRKKIGTLEDERHLANEKKVWFGKRIYSFFLGKGLRESIHKLYSELPSKVTKETLADVSFQAFKRYTRIGFFTVLGAIIAATIPYVLLYQQNSLLESQNFLLENQNQKTDRQNKLFSIQNDKIDSQIELLEADRRSSLIFLMSNIMDRVDNELKIANSNSSIRSLSPELIGRIAALSHSFKPYKYLDNKKLVKVPLSPERGQLLLGLIYSKLDTSCLRDIFMKADFSYADLKRVDLENSYLVNCK